jgi:integrase
MASLGKKGDLYVARFRYQGQEYKRSLKTTRPEDARGAMMGVERAIHGLTTGMIQMPAGADVGDFIVSGGTLKEMNRPRRKVDPLSELVQVYLAAQSHKAASSVYTEGIHLGNLLKHLESRAAIPADKVVHRDLDQFLQARLKERTSSTVHKERDTIRTFFSWLVANGYLDASPAAALSAIKGEVELAPFRTISEIDGIVARGGLSDGEILKLWDCLYLTPAEIADLLLTIRQRSDMDYGFLLHAIPAYTGMRRGEILRLRWSDVESSQGYIIARSLKQSRRAVETRRRIDLHSELGVILGDWRKQRPKGQFVVCEPDRLDPLGPDKANRVFWQPMRGTPWCLNSKRNLFKVGFHSYRHSFASNLAAAGVDQRVIDEFMGHTTEAMRRRYRHLFPNVKRSAIATFSLTTSNQRK